MKPPAWLRSPRMRHFWKRPWRRNARRSRKFKRLLREHGYLSPHYPRSEADQNDGTRLPGSLVKPAQRQAFFLERLRHQCGDVAIPILSWWRSVAYNAAIGGALASKHILAIASDVSSSVINRIGRTRFFAAANRIYANGGVGTYPSGSGHVDCRGYRSRWTSF